MTTTLDKLDTINDSLNDIKTAVIAKGVTPTGDITTYATAISNITELNNTTLSVTPTTSAQSFTVSSPYTGYSSVDVSAVTSSIDNNIVASNIVSGVSILGVNGSATVLNGETRSVSITSTAGNTFTPSSGKNAITSITVTPTNEARTVNPSTSSQSLTVNSGYSGNGIITVNPVTSSIDANITAENIKKDVTILGVTGSLESGGGTESTGLKANYVLTSSDGTTYDIGKLTNSSNLLDPKATVISIDDFMSSAYRSNTNVREVNLSSLSTVSGGWGLQQTFDNCSNLTTVDLSSLTTVSGNYSFYWCFRNCTSLQSINFPVLTEISGIQAFGGMCKGCTSLTDVSFPVLTTVSNEQGIISLFSGCTSLTTVDFPALTTVSNTEGLRALFDGCTSLTTVNFPALTTISGQWGLCKAFDGCTSLTTVDFPALTTNSFSLYTNQFENILLNTGSNVTHTIHFPSNLQSVISGLSGYPTFGGTSGYVVLAFDLPATS